MPIDANNTTLWESQQRGSGDKIELYSHFTTLCDGSVAKRDVLLEDLAGRLGLVLVATKPEEYES